MDGQHAIVFAMFDRATGVFGYTWILEWSTTSFYLKTTYKPLQLTKVSLHGPDPKHIGKQHFRLDFEHPGPAAKAIANGGGWSVAENHQLPLYFAGRAVNKRTVHVARFSATSDMFVKGVPSAPTPTRRVKATLHAVVPAPAQLKVTHVDIFLSTVRPYWENESKLRARDAGMGPIVNSAGMYLTAINYQRPALKHPDPFGDVRGGVPIAECVRGIGAKVDPAGFLWVCEKLMPQSHVVSTSLPPPPRGAPPPATPSATLLAPGEHQPD